MVGRGSTAPGNATLTGHGQETHLQTIILLLGIGVFAAVAYSDIRTRRIPNKFIVAILALTAVRIALAGDPGSALYTLGASVALFIATFLLFWRGLLGGGDVKLISATALLIGYHDLFALLFVMSISGALVAVAVLARNKFMLRPQAAPAAALAETPARLTVPYGVAIAAAGVFTLFVQSFPLG